MTEMRCNPLPVATGKAQLDLLGLVSTLKDDPVLRRFIQEYRTAPKRPVPIAEPWQALGEQRMFALMIASTLAGAPVSHYPMKTNIDVGREDGAFWCNFLPWQIARAATYYWTNEVFSGIMASPPLPPHRVQIPQAPFPLIYMTTYGAFNVYDNDKNSIGETDFTLIATMTKETLTQTRQMLGDLYRIPDDMPPSITMVRQFQDLDKNMNFIVSQVTEGQRFPEDFGAAASMVEQYLKTMAFLNTPLLQTEAHRLPRSIRREQERKKPNGCERAFGNQWSDPQINVVMLRQGRTESRTGAGSEVEWQHRWWVSGHWRNQWHPSSKSHSLRWISPYVKGPEEKPFLQKVYAVSK